MVEIDFIRRHCLTGIFVHCVDMKQITTLAFLLICLSLSAQDYDVFIDQRDGTAYQTVRIGKQVWMAENLKYATKSSRAIYPNNSPLVNVFGRLYCWEAAQEVCPDGWHLPSLKELEQLADQLGGARMAGATMKKNSPYWSTKLDELSNNSSGFSGIPGGYLEDPGDDTYTFMGDMGFFWSTTEKSRRDAHFKYLNIEGEQFKTGSGPKESGMSVRCLKD